MVEYISGRDERTPEYLTILLEDPAALEREQVAGGVPSAVEVADFVRTHYEHYDAVRTMADLLWVAMKGGHVNSGCFYTCILLELHGDPVSRFARKEMVSTMERFWRL